jgi:UDP-N-acetylmuramoyl-tripeptide--D-alanyl-D-alanine ligase
VEFVYYKIMKKQMLGRLQDFFGKALGRIAARYIKKFQPRIIVIAGSVGKTATTQAIATTLREHFQVRATIANYNTATGVPLSILGERFPVSRMGWVTLIPRMWLRSGKKQDFDLLVLEIGTDHPGELQQFAYLRPDIGVVTAVAPEHMEFFPSLEAVAAEELSIGSFCEKLIVNKDMVQSKLLKAYAPEDAVLIGTKTKFTVSKPTSDTVTVTCGSMTLKKVKTNLVGTHSLYALLVSATVAQMFGQDEAAIRLGLENITPIPGRMQLLDGIKQSKIIDDTYNSSPEAALAALDTLYSTPGKQRIALLGSMNELGKTAPQAHREVGNYCDPKKLDLVVTLGDLANNFTAKAAKKRGCEVIETDSPYAAAAAIQARLKPNAVILAKGSQNGVFAEETVKQLLKDAQDQRYLVRQSPYWLAVKRVAFQDSPHA